MQYKRNHPYHFTTCWIIHFTHSFTHRLDHIRYLVHVLPLLMMMKMMIIIVIIYDLRVHM